MDDDSDAVTCARVWRLSPNLATSARGTNKAEQCYVPSATRPHEPPVPAPFPIDPTVRMGGGAPQGSALDFHLTFAGRPCPTNRAVTLNPNRGESVNYGRGVAHMVIIQE